jgi:choline dehydrogenase-like flavoprotein
VLLLEAGRLAVPQGRVIGSAVDAAVAMRTRPADFARWAKRGIEGWSWDEARAPLVSSTVVGMADAIATGRTSDVAAARSQAEAALGAYSTDEGEQSEKRNGTDGQWTGGQARALDGLDYWVMQARLWLVQAACDPEP